MKRLFHLTTTKKYLDWFSNDWDKVYDFAVKHHMDGIELGLTSEYNINKIPKDLVCGVHLSFYPIWLEFWRGDLKTAADILGGMEKVQKYYGGLSKQDMIDNYIYQYHRAKELKAHYMVFHVSHVRPADSFTFEFSYTDKEVLEAAIELINAVFTDKEGPLLLFENLWWPGLTFKNPKLTKWFFDQINYPHKGFVIDISHLILTHPQIANERQAYYYIKEVVEKLEECSEYLYCMHLNKTLPKFYINRDHTYTLNKYQNAPENHKQSVLKKHISMLDPHKPFDHEIAKKIVECIKPKYCVYETNPESIYELGYYIKQQNKYLDIIY